MIIGNIALVLFIRFWFWPMLILSGINSDFFKFTYLFKFYKYIFQLTKDMLLICSFNYNLKQKIGKKYNYLNSIQFCRRKIQFFHVVLFYSFLNSFKRHLIEILCVWNLQIPQNLFHLKKFTSVIKICLLISNCSIDALMEVKRVKIIFTYRRI